MLRVLEFKVLEKKYPFLFPARLPRRAQVSDSILRPCGHFEHTARDGPQDTHVVAPPRPIQDYACCLESLCTQGAHCSYGVDIESTRSWRLNMTAFAFDRVLTHLRGQGFHMR